jgi:hypothetical protein
VECPHCRTEVRESEERCPACYSVLGFPNVRAAQKPEEKAALAARYEAAIRSATTRSCEGVFEKFLQAVRSSRAVICRSLSKVKELVSSDNELYASFYQLVGLGARRPEDTPTERLRLVADDLLFPYYRDKIRFATLSLNGKGATTYGDCSIVLRDLAICHRATVFEENSLHFFKRRQIRFGESVPSGYRAVWEQRHELAAAKLEPALQEHMESDAFENLLLRPAQEQVLEDFIEVHIYGSLGRDSIERLVVTKPRQKADQVILAEIERIFRTQKYVLVIEANR